MEGGGTRVCERFGRGLGGFGKGLGALGLGG